MEAMKKFLDVEIKAPEIEDRTLMFTASTEDRDRDGDVLDVKGWSLEPFKKNPVFMWAHDYRRPPIGRGIEVDNSGDKLRIKIEFVPPEIDPFADQVYKLFKAGFMRTVSVGFMPTKMEELTDQDKKQRPEVKYGRRISAELLELSAVPVPSNPMAVSERAFQEVLVKGLILPDHAKEPETPRYSVKTLLWIEQIKRDLDALEMQVKNLRP